jgi:hypothetical protein
MEARGESLVSIVVLVIFLALEIALAGLSRASKEHAERVLGKAGEPFSRFAGGMWGAAIYTMIFYVSWSMMAEKKVIVWDAVTAGVLIGAVCGFEIFWLLERFLFNRVDLGDKAIYASTAFGLPILIMGTIAIRQFVFLSLLIVAPISWLAALYIGSEWIGFEDKDKETVWTCIWVMSGFFGSVIGFVYSEPWYNFFANALGGMILCAAIIGGIYAAIWAIEKALSPIIGLSLKKSIYKAIICNTCYRYTMPTKSTYEKGIRYCEHCNHAVDFTKETGKVIFVYGDFHLNGNGRKFVFRDFDCAKHPYQMDISELYLDSESADPALVEKFVTHVREACVPRHGTKAVRVFYRGPLCQIGKNLENVILNNFPDVVEVN